MGNTTSNTIQSFIDRWQASGAAERANYQLFLSELCGLIGVEQPHPKTAHEDENSYVFDKVVPFLGKHGRELKFLQTFQTHF